MSKKRSWAEGVDVQLVEIYEDLTSDVETVRAKAAKSLIERITTNPETQEKVLQRLFRGLASGRKSARIGFSVALTEILHIWPTVLKGQSNVTVAGIIDQLEANTKIAKDAKGQESRDHYLGKVFGLAAIVQSGLLFADNRDADLWERIVNILCETCKQKVWLREECGWILYQSVKALKSSPVGTDYVLRLLHRLEVNIQLKTPEGVAVWIAVQREFPDLKLPKGTFHHQDPLNRKERATLSRILKQSSLADQPNGETAPRTLSSLSTGAWSSRPHFAWDVVLGAALKPRNKQITFAEFWKEAVDESLFSLKASLERKYWGFTLFQKYLLSAPISVIPCLFGANLLGTLKYQLRSDEKSLNAMAVDVVDSIIARSLEDKDAIPELVIGFLKADVNFDRFAKAKPVEKLVGQADLASLQRIVMHITDQIEQMSGQEETEDRHGLTSLADILVSVLRSHKFPENEMALESYRCIVNLILETFVQRAFAGDKTVQATQDMFKQRLMSSLNHVTAKDPQPAHHPCRTIAMIRGGVGEKEVNAEREVLDAIEQGSKLLESIQTKESTGKDHERQKSLQAFELLLAFALLQAYSGEAESVNTIDDLSNCYQSFVKHRASEDEAEESTALIEIIVEFVSKPSALYRRLAPKILSAFSSRVNEEGLDVMLKVLGTTENTSGQTELFANDVEDNMDLEAGSDFSPEEDSDVELVDAAASESSASEISDTESSDASQKSSEENAELQAFDAQLAAALGTQIADANGAEADDSDSDSDMTDTAMEALDAHLSTIFKQRLDAERGLTRKQRRRGARDTIINFKTKILELLEAYIKPEYGNPAALHIIMPLLRSMQYTGSPQIAQKSCELIRQFTKLYKLRTVQQDGMEGHISDPYQRDAALNLLKDIHAFIHETGSSMQAKACTSASLLATKVYLFHGGKLANVTQIYENTKKSFPADGESKFRQCFLEDWHNWQTQAEKNGQLEGR